MSVQQKVTKQFIDKLLAPLPEDAEQAEDKAFLLQLRRDMKEVWYGKADLLTLSRAKHAFLAQPGRGNAAWKAYIALIDKQMKKPAHGRTELKWKIRKRKMDGGRPEWEAAIKRDEQWIARLDKAGIGVRRASRKAA